MPTLRYDDSTYDSKKPSLACCVLGGPSEVTSLETESPELSVSSTYANGVDTLGAKLGVGGLATELEFSLLAVMGALSTRRRTFVPR